MDFSVYQSASAKTAIYPKKSALEYLALGLTSEAGEVAGKVKKAIRDHDGVIDEARRDAIMSEIGDVLWYCARLTDELGIDFNVVAQDNISKLLGRQNAGTLGGDGDTR